MFRCLRFFYQCVHTERLDSSLSLSLALDSYGYGYNVCVCVPTSSPFKPDSGYSRLVAYVCMCALNCPGQRMIRCVQSIDYEHVSNLIFFLNRLSRFVIAKQDKINRIINFRCVNRLFTHEKKKSKDLQDPAWDLFFSSEKENISRKSCEHFLKAQNLFVCWIFKEIQV